VSPTWLVLAMGAGVFALRLAGLVLPSRSVPAAWDRALAFVPIALLAALVVASLSGGSDGSASGSSPPAEGRSPPIGPGRCGRAWSPACSSTRS
jgi:branched-subunit amino acid transport protein